MTKEEFQKGLIELAKKNKEFAAIGAFDTLWPREVAEILHVSLSTLRREVAGTEVLTRINVANASARRPSYHYNKREVIGLQILRHLNAVKQSAAEQALEMYDDVA